MSWLCDTTELVSAGWLSSFYAGHGIRGDAVPSDGDNGPSPLYNDITLPAEAADEFRILLKSAPSAGTLTLAEDSAFTFGGAPDGVYSWVYEGFKNGTSYGDQTVTLIVGSTAAALIGNAAAVAAAGGILTTAIPLTGAALAQAAASGTLTVPISGFGGDAFAQASAGGTLTTGIRLQGDGLAIVTASGTLAVLPIALSGDALSFTVANGQLTAQIRLAGSATVTSSAAADLTGGTPANQLTAADINPDTTVWQARRFRVWRARRFTVSKGSSHARH